MPRKEAAKGGSSGGKKGKEAATPAAAAAPAPVEPKPKRLKVNLPGGATVTAAPVPEAVAARLGEFEQRRRELVDQLRETEKQVRGGFGQRRGARARVLRPSRGQPDTPLRAGLAHAPDLPAAAACCCSADL